MTDLVTPPGSYVRDGKVVHDEYFDESSETWKPTHPNGQSDRWPAGAEMRTMATIPTPTEEEQNEIIATAVTNLRDAIKILRSESDRIYFKKLPKIQNSFGMSAELNSMANQLVDVVRELNGQEPIHPKRAS